MQYEIIAIGDGQFLYHILNFLALLNSSNMFLQLGLLGAVLGLVFSLLQSITTGGRDIPVAQTFVGVMLFMVLFGQQVTVTVEDFYSGRTRTIDNVPFGTAVIGSMISRVGIGITEKFMQASAPTNTNSPTLPYQYALDALMASRDLTDGDFYKDDSMRRFMRTGEEYMASCALPMYRANGNKWPDGEPDTADNALLAMKSTNRVFTMNNYLSGTGGGPRMVTCDEGWSQLYAFSLSPQFTASVDTVLKRTLHREVAGVSSMTDVYEGVFEMLDQSTADAQQWQRNAVTAAIKQKGMSQAIGRDDVASAVLITTAANQRNVQFSAEASLWLRMARGIMTFFEGVAYGMAPFAALLIPFGAYGLRIGLRYAAVLLWIFLWTPLLAFVNMFTVDAMSGQLDALYTTGGAPLHSIIGIMDAQYTAQDYIGLSGWMAPTVASLAGFFVFGGLAAFGGLASRVNGADFVAEKMAAPNITDTGALMSRQSAMSASAGEAAMSMNRVSKTWSNKDLASQSTSLSAQAAQSSYADFAHTLDQTVGRSAEFGSGAQTAMTLLDSRTLNRSGGVATDDGRSVSSERGSGADQSFGVETSNASGTTGRVTGSINTPGGSVFPGSASGTLAAETSQGSREVDAASLRSGVTQREAASTGIREQQSATDVAALAKGIATGKVDTASLGLSAKEGEALTAAAKRAWTATESYSEAQSVQSSMDSTRTVSERQGVQMVLGSGQLDALEQSATSLGTRYGEHKANMEHGPDGTQPAYASSAENRAAAALLALDSSVNNPSLPAETRAAAANALSTALGMESSAGQVISGVAAGSAVQDSVGDRTSGVGARVDGASELTGPGASAGSVFGAAGGSIAANENAINSAPMDTVANSYAGQVHDAGATGMAAQRDAGFQQRMEASSGVLASASDWSSKINNAIHHNAGGNTALTYAEAALAVAQPQLAPAVVAQAMSSAWQNAQESGVASTDLQRMQAKGYSATEEGQMAEQIYKDTPDLARYSVLAGAGPELREHMGVSSKRFDQISAGLAERYGASVVENVGRTSEIGLVDRPEIQNIARDIADYARSR